MLYIINADKIILFNSTDLLYNDIDNNVSGYLYINSTYDDDNNNNNDDDVLSSIVSIIFSYFWYIFGVIIFCMCCTCFLLTFYVHQNKKYSKSIKHEISSSSLNINKYTSRYRNRNASRNKYHSRIATNSSKYTASKSNKSSKLSKSIIASPQSITVSTLNTTNSNKKGGVVGPHSFSTFSGVDCDGIDIHEDDNDNFNQLGTIHETLENNKTMILHHSPSTTPFNIIYPPKSVSKSIQKKNQNKFLYKKSSSKLKLNDIKLQIENNNINANIEPLALQMIYASEFIQQQKNAYAKYSSNDNDNKLTVEPEPEPQSDKATFNSFSNDNSKYPQNPVQLQIKNGINNSFESILSSVTKSTYNKLNHLHPSSSTSSSSSSSASSSTSSSSSSSSDTESTSSSSSSSSCSSSSSSPSSSEHNTIINIMKKRASIKAKLHNNFINLSSSDCDNNTNIALDIEPELSDNNNSSNEPQTNDLFDDKYGLKTIDPDKCYDDN